MLVPLRQLELRRTHDKLEIISVLQEIPPVTQSRNAILIGSRAVIKFLPNYRDENNKHIDWDIISSPTYLLEWLRKHDEMINSIEMIIPTLNGDTLDLYVHCSLKNDIIFDFAVSRSPTSYTTYILNNLNSWYESMVRWYGKHDQLFYASKKLLLILKKYMLYYPHQWEKTAKDYRHLLSITDPVDEGDKELCDLFIRYNEKLHGERSPDKAEFVMTPQDSKQDIVINRNKFFQYTKDEQIVCVYQAASSMSIDSNILMGLEHICTKSPPWLANFVIDNWIDILNEKYKQKRPLARSCIQFEIHNYRLFQQLPGFVTKKILLNITDPLDFYSMKSVCKNWYIIINQQSFWRVMYLARYGQYAGDINTVTSWKLLFLIKLKNETENESIYFEQLVDVTIQLSETTANDVLRLWEDFTHENQSVHPDIVSQINYIFSHSYYFYMNETSNYYSVKLVLIGLYHPRSQSIATLNLRVGAYGSSYFTDHMEELSIKCNKDSDDSCYLSFMGPELFGFDMGERFYYRTERGTLLTSTPSEICPALPSGIALCLFTMMVHPAHRAQFISYLRKCESNCRSKSLY
ncbi:unnamed protein product [Rotaria sp. Silwood1]|nr:unnamed protein product [Rotaria sp. Silwood1]